MIFTIEFKGMDRHFRRKKDNSWRTIKHSDISLQENDYQTNDPKEVLAKSCDEGVIEIDGIEYNVNPIYINWGRDNILNPASLVFRKNIPHLPSIDQLRDVIANGDDSKHNSLILNVYGNFELRSLPSYDISKNDPTVIVRHETYSAGNGYVGVESSKDDNHINQEYAASLELWASHLKTGGTQMYCDSTATRELTDILEEIQQMAKI